MKIPMMAQEIKLKRQALNNGEYFYEKVQENEKKKQSVRILQISLKINGSSWQKKSRKRRLYLKSTSENQKEMRFL